MAKSTTGRTRSTSKKKLQDVIESIPEETEKPAEPVETPATRRAAASAPDADESQFVATEEAEEAAEPEEASMAGAPPLDAATPPEEVETLTEEQPKKKRHKDYDESSPIDRETHEKYERVKRGELHITDLQKMSGATSCTKSPRSEGIEEFVGLPKQDLIFQILKRRI